MMVPLTEIGNTEEITASLKENIMSSGLQGVWDRGEAYACIRGIGPSKAAEIQCWRNKGS